MEMKMKQIVNKYINNTQKGKIIKLILKAEEAKTKLYSIQKHIKEGPLF